MPDNSTVSFNGDTRRYLRNTLNEVVNGIRPTANLEKRILDLRPAASMLLRKLTRDRSRFDISASDASLLLETCRICDEDFEGDEFRTRLGFTRAEAERVSGLLQELSGQPARQVHAAAS